jgi:hypothetical protein
MSTINENPRVSDVILFEEGRHIEYTREQITVILGTAASVIGQVLGQITIGAASSAARSGGNTEDSGALTLDATTPILVNAQVGVYKVRCITAATGGGTFRVTDPLGRVLGDVAVGATFAEQIKFAIAAGSADFVVGDGFDITVAAGSGKWTQVNPSATDGSQNAAGILIASPFSAQLAADAVASAVTRGPAIVKTGGLAWTTDMTAGQKTVALAQLKALGITSRTDYGV